MMIKVLFWMAVLIIGLLVALYVLPIMVALIVGMEPTNCGRACLLPGVTENPNITLIGG